LTTQISDPQVNKLGFNKNQRAKIQPKTTAAAKISPLASPIDFELIPTTLKTTKSPEKQKNVN